jgi:hypothetical protein
VERAKKYGNIDDYLLKIRSKGRYSIILKELNRIFDFSEQIWLYAEKRVKYADKGAWKMVSKALIERI